MNPRNIEAEDNAPEEHVSACRKTCSNWFDRDFFKSVINVKDIFCPMSWKKPLWWGTTAAALGGIIAIEVTTGAFSTAATYNNVGIMAVLYGVDPVVQTINVIAAKYQPALATAMIPKSEDELVSAMEMVEDDETQHHQSAQYSPYGSEVESQLEAEQSASLHSPYASEQDAEMETIHRQESDIEMQLSETTNYSPYASEAEIKHQVRLPNKDKSELDSPYHSENETVYDYIVDDEPVEVETDLEREIKANHLKNKDVAVVIPTHLAADKIEATIRSLLVHVKPHQIFIIDNGNSNEPQDNTREVVASVSPDINYVWGHRGNKTYAQLIGAFLAKDFKYIYTSDDDMRVPRYFSFGAERINDTVKAVCYPILGVHPEPGETNWWIRAQSLEYTLADCSKLAQDRFGDVLYPHGAASLWEKETFMRVLHKHTAIFYAEDVQFGMILQQIGYAMTMEAGACLDTEAPTSLFGPNPNFVQQRGRSWEMGRQSNYFKFLYQLFCVAPPTKSPINFVMHKLAEAYAVYTNTVDWMRFPLFLIMLRNPDYWIRLAIVVGAGYVPILGWNYIKLPLNNRQDLQANFLDILTFPIFKLVESAMSIYGIGRLLAVYGPNYTHKPTVQEFEDSFRQDPVALEKEIYNDARNPAIPPVTYKTVMYGRFFRPAQGVDEIEREFDANMYRLYQDALIESLEQGRQHPYTPSASAEIELAEAAPRVNPIYGENPLQMDNPLFDDESSSQQSRHAKPVVSEIEQNFEENKFHIYTSAELLAMDGTQTNPVQLQAEDIVIELGAAQPMHNPVYQNNPLQQDNPLFDDDSSSLPMRYIMKM